MTDARLEMAGASQVEKGEAEARAQQDAEKGGRISGGSANCV